MPEVLRKFLLILWKNLLLCRRHWIMTSLEICLPPLIFILPAVIKSFETRSFESTVVPEQYNFIKDEIYLDLILKLDCDQHPILYAPSNNVFSDAIMDQFINAVPNGTMGFPNEDELLNYYYSNYDSAFSHCAVVFQDLPINGDIPTHLKYKIRISNKMYRTSELFNELSFGGPGYSGLKSLERIQMIIDKRYIELVGGPTGYQLAIQDFPYPEYIPASVNVMDVMLQVCTVISFLVLCTSVLKKIVQEKETGVKELMKMMGLKTWMLWLGWLMNTFLINLIPVSIIIIILKVPFGTNAILSFTNGFLMWIIFLTYIICSIAFCFAVSSFFYKPTVAITVGNIVWMTSYSALTYLVVRVTPVAPSVKIATSLLPNTAIGWIFRLVNNFESLGVGLQWNNFFEPVSSTEGNISVGLLWCMLIVDTVIFFIIAWYFDNVIPGKYGIAKPWYFIVMPSYWWSKKMTVNSEIFNDETRHTKKFEQPPSNLSVGIKIKNLSKVFQSLGGYNKKVAVDGMTLDIYSGEITALLGHNGAGKTTTMSILTGMYSPTSGTVYVDGYDICNSLDKVRKSLGLCPQHNMLFSDLTVSQHLIFFAMLKGSTLKEARRETEELIQKLILDNKENELSSKLSGGMKRKLSLGIALIGNSKVLILDEPTSGMDPEARRKIWDMLLQMRGERTILFTTHYMEEADVLGDRIAIMDHGKVQCYGTSIFLKKIYGTGYQLNLLKEEGCDVPLITQIVQQTIPDSKIKSEMGTLITYMLPSEHTDKFSNMFDSLERDKQALGIASIGVSITTLEEVFLRAGRHAENEQREHNGLDTEKYLNDDSENELGEHNKLDTQKYLNDDLEGSKSNKVVGISLILQQLKALLKKKVLFMYRKWVIYSFQAVMSILFAVLTIVLSNAVTPNNEPDPPRVMNLRDFGDTEVLFNFAASDPTWSDNYKSLINQVGSHTIDTYPYALNIALMNAGYEDIDKYKKNMIVAAELNMTGTGPIFNAMFTTLSMHSSAISLNLLTNAILKTTKPDNQITVTNHPLESKMSYGFGSVLNTLGIELMWLLLMSYAAIYMVGDFLRFPILERVSKLKQLQMMSGTSPLLYWFACFICNFCFYLFILVIMTLLLLADPMDFFNRSEEMGVYFFIFFMYGLSVFPYVYLFSYFTKTFAGGFSLYSIINVFIGTVLAVVTYVMQMSDDYKTAVIGVKAVFQLMPQYTITYTLGKFAKRVLQNNICVIEPPNCLAQESNPCCRSNCLEGPCPEIYKPYLEFSDTGIGEQLLYFGLTAILYTLLLMLVQYDIVSKFYDQIMGQLMMKMTYNDNIEDDVLQEKQRIDGKIAAGIYDSDTEDVMLVHNLTKQFKANFSAVKGINFGLAPGECFGLLGFNGAGKTTSFNMLTGDVIPTEGNAWIGKYSLTAQKSKLLTSIGYCPQFDAINEALTGREMLELFAYLRGVKPKSVDYEVNKWISLLGLSEYENRQCGTYSGGNKRKLSIAMALIGDPPIIFLDEPTSGVDPLGRRNLWNVIIAIQKSGQSVVLTSHSMEECEALCNRLAIMVSGQFACLGSTHYLKQKYGQGFTVMLKLRVIREDNDTVNVLKRDIEYSFMSECVLKDEHQGLLHYHITNPNTAWKKLFTTLERIKHEYEIVEDYTISETSLEQVFLSFANAGIDKIINSHL